MSVLFRNDRAGRYPDSWYAATSSPPDPRHPLRGEERTDVCIIGAGYTGLTAALHAARAGLRVVVVEAHRAGFGASGRNGGQVGSGYNKSQLWLSQKLGKEPARTLWSMAEEAKRDLRDFADNYADDVLYRSGVAHGAYTAGEVEDEHRDAEFLETNYGYNQIEPLDADQIQDLVKTKSYVGGILDNGAGHIHPLRYALALARAAEEAGATIYENSPVHQIVEGDPATIRTDKGRVIANHVIVAGNGYLPNVNKQITARVMPINSYIGATAPLTPDQTVLARDIAVADSKFVVNYFRMSHDNRLLFGGRESYSVGFPKDISTALHARMVNLFPQLDGIALDYVWGGTLGITMSRLPSVQRVSSNVISGAGFSGHGVALSGFTGKVMAAAITGQATQFDTLSSLPTPSFPGGGMFRAPMLTLAMTWYSLRDRLGI